MDAMRADELRALINKTIDTMPGTITAELVADAVLRDLPAGGKADVARRVTWLAEQVLYEKYGSHIPELAPRTRRRGGHLEPLLC